MPGMILQLFSLPAGWNGGNTECDLESYVVKMVEPFHRWKKPGFLNDHLVGIYLQSRGEGSSRNMYKGPMDKDNGLNVDGEGG